MNTNSGTEESATEGNEGNEEDNHEWRIPDFSTDRFVSLTPCSSWVLSPEPVGVNRFNGFEGPDFWICARLQIRIGELKPLKRLTVAPSLPNTRLKQGVNEMGRGRKNLRCALFLILIPVVYRLPFRPLFPSLP